MILYSHPNKPLVKHLEEVADNCRRVVYERVLFKDKKEVLTTIAYIMGAFHDIGKGTSYFQHYLLSPEHEVIGPKSHALISALFVKEVVKRYLAQTDLNTFEQQLFTHFAFTGVKRHHGSLENFDNELCNITGELQAELKKQIAVFHEPETESIIRHFLAPLGMHYAFADFKAYIQSEKYPDDLYDFYDEEIKIGDIFEGLSAATKMNYFYFHQLLFGVLLLSDKRDVILENERHAAKPVINDDVVDVFRKKKEFDTPKNDLDKRKNEALSDALAHLQNVFLKDKHIYSLTLPTGLGKTITSFAVALAMKKKLNLPHQRLIVIIPFTSIIDQNFEVYRDILDTDNSDMLLKHHHLAEPTYKMADDDVTKTDKNKSLDAKKSQFLIETWQSEVVITTSVQLLNSIFSNDKSLLMKLPNLANAIVILDEVQTINYAYWQLVKKTFQTIGRCYNCYFIMMSATQPLIFTPDEEITELIPDYEKYFKLFNRTKIINRTENEISLSDFVGAVSDYLAENTRKDILIIFNTKAHSKKCFEILRETIDMTANDVYYLSTLITPFERKKIIALIKTKSEKRKIIVSTQLVEAGVDISVDTVFRALAPIDSIIQAAGRANRYDEKSQQGEVYIYEISEMIKATRLIYGSDLILKTKNVLKSVSVIEEKDYLALIKNYFKEVKKQSDSHLSVYLEGIENFNFKDVGKFSLIEERATDSVFLQLNVEAKKVWDEFTDIFNQPDTVMNMYEKKQAFTKIKSRFYDYVINIPIPIPKLKENIDFDSEKQYGFYLSELQQPTRFYDYDAHNFSKNTGYKSMTALSF